MSTSLDVDGIRLLFDDSWSVEKWDDSRGFQDGLYKLNGSLDGRDEGSKAMDVIGLRGGVPYLFEVKDFRGFAIENKHRQLSELPLELGLKARDTIAGLVGLISLDKGEGLPEAWLRATQRPAQSVRVFALFAEDAARPGEPNRKRHRREDVRADRLERRLAWLTPKVFIKDPLRESESLRQMFGITAESLAGAGPARPR